jgi:predicted PurR-regulated permease PerM
MIPAPAPERSVTLGILAAGAVLAMLYFARDVLVPITLAVILSLLIAPTMRGFRRVGLGHASSVLAAVLVAACGLLALAAAIGTQLVHMTADLPRYERTIQSKVQMLDHIAVKRLSALKLEVQSHAAEPAGAQPPSLPPEPVQTASPVPAVAAPVPVTEAPTGSLQILQRVLGSIWLPIETTGIVLVVLVFVLLEHEALRDRLIRIAGSTDIRATTNALNDASRRLSRFFGSQFSVNFGVGAVIWVGLLILGLPHALLWAALAAVLRFVPYAGIWLAALVCALFAAAVQSGWSLSLETLGLYVAVELVASQLVEPQLYGHATGLSPLSVVIAAIFWSWLWGPVGLILSTPLTLCLLVAGRHTRTLAFLDVLLGDTPALTMPQRLFQRALSGDSDEIIANARLYLRTHTFASYCDLVLMPALHLARLDFSSGGISEDQQVRVRTAVAKVIAVLGGDAGGRSRRRMPAVLDDMNVGRHLRRQREILIGKYQGPIQVPPGSVILCMGLGSIADDLATEVLVRILRAEKVDARHIANEDFTSMPPGASADSVALIHIVSAYPCAERERGASVAAEQHARFPQARIVKVYLPGLTATDMPQDAAPVEAGTDRVANSFEEAVRISLARD